MIYHLFKKSRAILFTPLLLALSLAVACGATTEPTSPPPTQAPAAQAAPTAAPPQAAAATPGPTLIGAAPVATPTRAPVPVVESGNIEGTVVVMIGSLGNEKLHPRYAAGETHHYGRLLHGKLVEGLGSGGVTPGTAESWRVNEDGTEWTFKLRKGVLFHNGEEATIDDFIFSINRAVDPSEFPDPPGSTMLAQWFFRGEREAEVTGPDEVSIPYLFSNPGALSWFSSGHAGDIRTALVPESVLGEPYDVNEPEYEKNPVGAGPMRLVDRSFAQSMTFERFDDHYYQPANGLPEDRRPRFKILEMEIVPELSTRVAALRAGEADIVEASLAVRKQIEGADGRLIFQEQSSYVYVLWQQCYLPETRCSDRRVRQALDWAVDEVLIRDTLYSEESAVVTGWQGTGPASLGWSPEVAPFGFDPDKARALLKEAGYKVPGSPEGKDYGPLTIATWDAGDVPFIPEMANMFAEFYKTELGIDATVVVGDSTSIRQKYRGLELTDQIVLRTNEAVWDMATRFPGAYIVGKSKTRSADPTTEPELAAIILESLAVVDPDKRHDAMNKAMLAANDAHYQWQPMYANLPWGVSKRIVDWKPWPVAAFFSSVYTVRLEE